MNQNRCLRDAIQLHCSVATSAYPLYRSHCDRSLWFDIRCVATYLSYSTFCSTHLTFHAMCSKLFGHNACLTLWSLCRLITLWCGWVKRRLNRDHRQHHCKCSHFCSCSWQNCFIELIVCDNVTIGKAAFNVWLHFSCPIRDKFNDLCSR